MDNNSYATTSRYQYSRNCCTSYLTNKGGATSLVLSPALRLGASRDPQSVPLLPSLRLLKLVTGC